MKRKYVMGLMALISVMAPGAYGQEVHYGMPPLPKASPASSQPVMYQCLGKCDIRTFILSITSAGIPYEKAASYTASDIPTLEKMLHEELPPGSQAKKHSIFVLGAIGGSQAYRALSDYAKQVPANDVVRYDIMSALGLLAIKDDTALKVLLDVAKGGVPADFPNFAIGNVPEQFKERHLRHNWFFAIGGLGISGRPEALDYLESERKTVPADYKEKLEQTIATNKRVHDEGFAKVFPNWGIVKCGVQ